MARVPGRPQEEGRRERPGLQRGASRSARRGRSPSVPTVCSSWPTTRPPRSMRSTLGDGGERRRAALRSRTRHERVASYLGAPQWATSRSMISPSTRRRTRCTCRSARARRRRPRGAAPHRRGRRVGERGRPRRRPDRVVRLDDAPDESDERSDVTLPTDGSATSSRSAIARSAS